MIQTGDPTGTGKGGQSLWGNPFADEVRSTLKVRCLAGAAVYRASVIIILSSTRAALLLWQTPVQTPINPNSS